MPKAIRDPFDIQVPLMRMLELDIRNSLIHIGSGYGVAFITEMRHRPANYHLPSVCNKMTIGEDRNGNIAYP